MVNEPTEYHDTALRDADTETIAQNQNHVQKWIEPLANFPKQTHAVIHPPPDRHGRKLRYPEPSEDNQPMYITKTESVGRYQIPEGSGWSPCCGWLRLSGSSGFIYKDI